MEDRELSYELRGRAVPFCSLHLCGFDMKLLIFIISFDYEKLSKLSDRWKSCLKRVVCFK